MGWGEVTAVDAMALTMLGVMFLGFGVISLIFLNIRRHATRRDAELEALLEEVEAEAEKPQEEKPAPVPETPPREPWERETDWWKK